MIHSQMKRRSFLSAAFGAAAVAQGRRRLPNFVILFADDMGYSDLGCYGNPVIRTPHLDKMAAQGMRMTSFYAAAPVCTPSRVGLLTGRYPVRAGQPNNFGPDSKDGLRLTEVLLPQMLKPLGYRTMAIGKWHLGHGSEEYMPTRRGFDSYFGLLYSNDMIPPWVKTERPLELYRDLKPIEKMDDQSRLTQRYTEEAVKFLRANANHPFFLYVPYAMPHLPVSAAEGFKDKSRGGLYGDAIEAIDWSVGQILRELSWLDVDEHTMVLFCSDNGPWHELPDRMLAKGVESWHTGTKGMLRGAKGSTWEGGIRVPGIVRWPGVIPAGQVSMEMATTLDVVPTVAAAAGVALPSGKTYDGFDLLGHWRGKSASPRREFFYFAGAQLQGVREGAWKYRVNATGKGELYHLDRDPAEMYDVAGREPEVAGRLARRLKEFGEEVKRN